jgi:hypothetical protein
MQGEFFNPWLLDSCLFSLFKLAEQSSPSQPPFPDSNDEKSEIKFEKKTHKLSSGAHELNDFLSSVVFPKEVEIQGV